MDRAHEEAGPDGTRGYLALVLHAHLPFVREAGGEATAAERQLFEAITDSYLPLLEALVGLVRDRVPYRLALSVSPTLLNMLTDRVVQTRYLRYLDATLEGVEHELQRSRESHPQREQDARRRERLRAARRAFTETWSSDLVSAFRELQEGGFVETLACSATHAHLPLLAADEVSVRAQIRAGLDEHRRFFGRDATGFWLPESAFFAGLDRVLAELGVRYFVLDMHGVAYARPRPVFGVWAPIVTPSGVAVFGSDRACSVQVEGSTGYATDPDYQASSRGPGSPRYVVERALAKVEAHAGNFVASREQQIDWLATTMGHPPIVVAPFDAELLGSRWYDGPRWIAATIRMAAYEQRSFALVTPSDYLTRHPIAQEAVPAGSSVGSGGYHADWLGGENDWIYRPLHRAGRRMTELARRHDDPKGLVLRALNQAARELLLAQSSDWARVMTHGPLVNDAVRRVRTHLARFVRLARDLDAGQQDEAWLDGVEAEDNPFPALDYRVFR